MCWMPRFGNFAERSASLGAFGWSDRKIFAVVAPRQHHSDSERDTIKKGRPANDILLAAAQKDMHKCWSVKRRKAMPRPKSKMQADAAIKTRGRKSSICIDCKRRIINGRIPADARPSAIASLLSGIHPPGRIVSA